MFSIPFLDLPPFGRAGGTVRLPGSKSISNRVLLLAALAKGTTKVCGLLESDDTRVMIQALRQLGCSIERKADQVQIQGLGDRVAAQSAACEQLFLGNAGTAMRPLTAALALRGGEFKLSGVARMHERPIGDLVNALRDLGCKIDYLGNPGFPPLQIHPVDPQALKLDEPIAVRGDVSSQFLTALLLALPLVAHRKPIFIDVVGELISRPYIEITLNLLARFGVEIEHDNWRRFTIPAGSQLRSPGEIQVEADASSASYFIAVGALSTRAAGQFGLKIEGVGKDSIQGDIRFADAAHRMGARIEWGSNHLTISRGPPGNGWPLRAIDLDCNHMPDAAMTLAVMALYADGPSTLRNIASWRVKETDRIDAIANELRKLGARVEAGSDFIRIWPLAAADWRAASIRTYDDHRMAMCFSLAAFNPGSRPIRITDPGCVAKTFPDYFETLFSLVDAQPELVPVICIDGPTASGKGTLAAEVARRLGYHYLDSGALYRVTGLVARREGLSPEAFNEHRIAALAASLALHFNGDQILLAGEDVSDALRTEAAGIDASLVSTLPAVRAALRELQESFRRVPGLVADGRDMGTVVFPTAALKIYLTASASHRAERRYKQLISKGISAKLPALQADLEARDARDSFRAIAPLKAAQDAHLLDNSGLSVEQSVERVLIWWEQVQPFQSI